MCSGEILPRHVFVLAGVWESLAVVCVGALVDGCITLHLHLALRCSELFNPCMREKLLHSNFLKF